MHTNPSYYQIMLSSIECNMISFLGYYLGILSWGYNKILFWKYKSVSSSDILSCVFQSVSSSGILSWHTILAYYPGILSWHTNLCLLFYHTVLTYSIFNSMHSNLCLLSVHSILSYYQIMLFFHRM